MKKLLFLMTVLVGSVAALQLFTGERRTRLKERWREIEEQMPPVVMMSSMRRFEEQNKLLRKQNKILRAAPSAGESRA